MDFRKYIYIVLMVVIVCLQSCTDKQNYTVLDKSFSNEEWARFDILTADYEVIKAPLTCDLILEIIVSDVYPNIYPYHEEDKGLFAFNMAIHNPEGNGSRSREYKFFLKDGDGNWKSELIDGYRTYQMPLIKGMTFSETGIYKFKIENKYSKDPLYGIKSFAIKSVPVK